MTSTLNAHYGDKWGLDDQHALNDGSMFVLSVNRRKELDAATTITPKGFESETFVTHSLRAEGFDASEDGTGRGTPLVPVLAFSCKDSGGDAGDISLTLRAMSHSGSHANAGGQTEQQRDGCVYEEGDGKTEETRPRTILLAMREALGAEALSQWGLGVLDELLKAQVLRPIMYGRALDTNSPQGWQELVSHTLPCATDSSEGAMLPLREAERKGCSPQGQGPHEQLGRQLGTHLSQLSQPGAQTARLLHDLWEASDGLGILRHALSAVQEMGRSVTSEGEPVRGGSEGHGSNSYEDLLISWLPEQVSRAWLLQQARATSKQRNTGDRPIPTETYAVRRISVVEAARLQGLPDTYCHIEYGNARKIEEDEASYLLFHGIECWTDGAQWMTKVAADGNMYRALGNSMAVPVMAWLGSQIQDADQQMKEAA